MAKASVRFVCSNCGAVHSSWAGRCSQCGEWNTLEEQLPLAKAGGKVVAGGSVLKPESVKASLDKDHSRLATGMKDVDTVLGGGFVAGSINLIAGQPGIGKSTLLLQVADLLAVKSSILYVSGEESSHQIGLRASRLKTGAKDLNIATTTVAEDIAATIQTGQYKLVVVDSIQTVACQAVASNAGSVAQITNSAQLITQAAKATGTAVILVGHVTKEGTIAGPKVLEHLVDVVLQLEGDRYGGFKILRAVKNRYGSTNEAGIFEMVDEGLRAVDNPSAALLAERQATDGSIVLATMEGSRPLLVEVQALVNKTSFGYPKRAASGLDLNRLNLLIAMLERRTKLNLTDQDIYVNIVGGMHIREPAADLAVCMAIATATKGMMLKENAVVFGEVGLSGEVRHVPNTDKRIAEAKKLGFDVAIGPASRTGKKLVGLIGVSSVRDALNQFLRA